MKRKNTVLLATAVMLLIVSACGQAQSDNHWRISGPFSQDNLSIFLVHSSDATSGADLVTLDEAIQKKYITVYETGDVNELAIENHSDHRIYIQSGSILKGGRQDRAIENDFVLESHSGRKPLSSFCVEHGRWSGRGNESSQQFEASTKMLPSSDLKRAAKVDKSQGKVWESVAEFQEKLAPSVRGGKAGAAESPSSLQLTMENDVVEEVTQQSLGSLSERIKLGNDAIGMVYAINGEITNADLYGSPALFNKLFRNLLEAAVLEAIAERHEKKRDDTVTQEQVLTWLETSRSEQPEIRLIGDSVLLEVHEVDGKVNFETYVGSKPGQFVHKNVMKDK